MLLATLQVRVDPSAERMAIDSALEASVPLLVVNLIRLPPFATTIILAGPEHTTLPHEEDLEAVRATANRAAELGVKTELLRVRTKRPVQALLQVAGERDAGLIVFGPAPRPRGADALQAGGEAHPARGGLPRVGRAGRLAH